MLNLLFFLFLWYILLAFFDVVVIAIQILVTFPIFAKFAEFFRAFLTFFFISLNFSLLCNSCYYYDIYQGGFFWCCCSESSCYFMRFLKTSLDFCEQFLLNKFLLKLGQKFSSKFLLKLSIIVEFIIFAIFSISSIHFWQQFPFNFFAKIATTICYQFLATVFSPRHKGVLLKTLLKGWNVTKDLSVTNSHWSFQCQRVGLKPRFHFKTNQWLIQTFR